MWHITLLRNFVQNTSRWKQKTHVFLSSNVCIQNHTNTKRVPWWVFKFTTSEASWHYQNVAYVLLEAKTIQQYEIISWYTYQHMWPTKTFSAWLSYNSEYLVAFILCCLLYFQLLLHFMASVKICLERNTQRLKWVNRRLKSSRKKLACQVSFQKKLIE